MPLIKSSTYIFVAILILVVIPSIWTTAWIIGISITLASLLVILQTILVLRDPNPEEGDYKASVLED